MSENAAYRDPAEGLRHEREALLSARRREASKLVPESRAVLSRRLGRSHFGMVGLVGSVVVIAGAVLSRPGLTVALLLGAAAAGGAYLFGRAVGRIRLDHALGTLLAPGNDSRHDVDRLERTTPLQLARRMADPLETRSIALPIAAWATLAPLGIYYVLGLFTIPVNHRLPRFDWWIELSIANGWPAIAVVAYMGLRYARRVRGRSIAELTSTYHGDGWAAYGYAVLGTAGWGIIRAMFALLARNDMRAGLSAVGYAVLPVAVVALTCLIYVPWMFAALHRRVSQERLQLGIEVGRVRTWP